MWLFILYEWRCTHGSKKEIVDGGMKNRVWYIIENELKRAIKLLQENKATDESGMIAEYIYINWEIGILTI